MNNLEVEAASAKRDFLFANIEVVPGSDCWEWQRCINSYGYGTVWYKGKGYVASRLHYILANGPIPEGLECCHLDDNPPCCNPSHMFLGTHTDNMRDMIAKGHNVIGDSCLPGELHGSAVLSDYQVANIKGLLLLNPWPGLQARLAEYYGVSPQTISMINIGETWPHIAPSPNPVLPWPVPIVKRRRVA